jgi:hypothetical protein
MINGRGIGRPGNFSIRYCATASFSVADSLAPAVTIMFTTLRHSAAEWLALMMRERS